MMETKNVLVTGGSSGMGKATVLKFLEMGYRVMAVDINEKKLEELKENNKEYTERDLLFGFFCDVSDPVSVEELRKKVAAMEETCDILVNCAGIYRGGLVHEASDDDFQAQMNVNVKGIFHMCRAMLPFMLKKGKGAIVNIASISGILADYNAPLYCASKYAVVGLTKAMALDYAEKGIRVNSVSPTATNTPMFLSGSTQDVINKFKDNIPDHKIGEAAQVANTIFFLASDQSEHINGHDIPLDGGLHAWTGQPKQNKDDSIVVND